MRLDRVSFFITGCGSKKATTTTREKYLIQLWAAHSPGRERRQRGRRTREHLALVVSSQHEIVKI